MTECFNSVFRKIGVQPKQLNWFRICDLKLLSGHIEMCTCAKVKTKQVSLYGL